jgi:hypothetical protein
MKAIDLIIQGAARKFFIWFGIGHLDLHISSVVDPDP